MVTSTNAGCGNGSSRLPPRRRSLFGHGPAFLRRAIDALVLLFPTLLARGIKRLGKRRIFIQGSRLRLWCQLRALIVVAADQEREDEDGQHTSQSVAHGSTPHRRVVVSRSDS